MGSVKTYDPKKVIISFGGVNLSGFPDGTFIEVSPSGDAFVKVVGADGEVARGRSNDDTHEVTLTLLQTSASNSVLSSSLSRDKLLGTGKGPLSIKDIYGGSLYFWPEAWIKADPTISYAKEVGERAWVFDTGQVAANNTNANYVL